MIDINNFIRQHKDILSDINEIDKIVSKQDYEEHLNEFVSHINSLAGKLKVHLSYEDKFLYPNLIKGEDMELKSMTEEYMREMGDIADVFTDYKNEFNTRSKINERLDTFKVDTKRILDEIQNTFESSNWKSFPVKLLTEITQCRKKQLMIMGSAQVYSRVSKQFRELSQYVVQCKNWGKTDRLFINRFFHAVDYDLFLEARKNGQEHKVQPFLYPYLV